MMGHRTNNAIDLIRREAFLEFADQVVTSGSGELMDMRRALEAELKNVLLTDKRRYMALRIAIATVRAEWAARMEENL